MASRHNPGMTFRRIDFSSLPLPDRSVDGIISFYSIIHTPKRMVDLLFKEFHRVLKEGGTLLVSVKEGDHEGYLDEFLGHRARIYFSHFRKEEIERLMIASGFRILFLESRAPYEEEIAVSRIYAIGER